MDNSSIQVARSILAFSWIYHGLFPKLLTIAPLEKALTATIGLSAEHSYFVTKAAGLAEILFGVMLFVLYKSKTIHLVNIAALFSLGIFVAINMPILLVEAFNPVTTNLALIGFSYLLLRAHSKNKTVGG
jgi:uncharacterized membrane protein YphA (DoxX/SURF4 family)